MYTEPWLVQSRTCNWPILQIHFQNSFRPVYLDSENVAERRRRNAIWHNFTYFVWLWLFLFFLFLYFWLPFSRFYCVSVYYSIAYLYMYISADTSAERTMEVNLYPGGLMDIVRSDLLNQAPLCFPQCMMFSCVCICVRDLMLHSKVATYPWMKMICSGGVLFYSFKLSNFHTNTLHPLSYDPVTCIH